MITPSLLGLWAVLLIVQNFSFTMVSRARNSGSLTYHAIASVFSNGVWFASQVILVGSLFEVIRGSNLVLGIGLGVFYTACTLTGSLFSHWVLMRYVEQGKRRVGA